MPRHCPRRLSAHRRDDWLPALPVARRSGVRSWLTDPGSLTRRLRAGGRFELRLLRQGPAAARRGDAAPSDLRCGRKMWRRDVLLLVDGEPRVFGHTVCALRDLRGAWRLVRQLGVRPVGDAVFSRPRTCRTALRVRHLSRGDPLARQIAQDLPGRSGAGCWVRRSAFVFRGRALWVSEAFFPPMP